MVTSKENIKNTEKSIEKEGVVCFFCKKLINNNTIKPLICVCEENNFFHFECYEKSSQDVNIDKVVKNFDKARIKY